MKSQRKNEQQRTPKNYRKFEWLHRVWCRILRFWSTIIIFNFGWTSSLWWTTTIGFHHLTLWWLSDIYLWFCIQIHGLLSVIWHLSTFIYFSHSWSVWSCLTENTSSVIGILGGATFPYSWSNCTKELIWNVCRLRSLSRNIIWIQFCYFWL